MVALSLDTHSLKEKVPSRKASRKRLLQGPTIAELNELGVFHLFVTVDGWWFLHQIDFSYDFVYQPIRNKIDFLEAMALCAQGLSNLSRKQVVGIPVGIFRCHFWALAVSGARMRGHRNIIRRASGGLKQNN